MARTAYENLEKPLGKGDRVHAYGQPELYAMRGTFQLRATTIEPVGIGDLLTQLENLRKKLAAEGLFDAERKRKLPLFPSRIGIITGSDAAAKRDIVVTATKRFPPAQLIIFETTVQGPHAPLAICGGLQTLAAQPEVDVIVLTRGGGSFEDLLPFSDERVIRAIADSPIPIISAVGHEHDHPLSDLAADARAATPTAAATLVVPDAFNLFSDLELTRRELRNHVRSSVNQLRDSMQQEHRLLLRAPLVGLSATRGRLNVLNQSANHSLAHSLAYHHEALKALGGRLRALSPTATLERGYALIRRGNRLVTDTSDIEVGELINVKLSHGSLIARVHSLEDTSQ